MAKVKALVEQDAASGSHIVSMHGVDDQRHPGQLHGFEKRELVYTTGLMLLAFLIRMYMLKYNQALDGDGVWYAMLGKSLAAGNLSGGLSTYWPPLYPLLIGISSLIFSDLEFAGRFVSIIAGSLLILPVYLLAKHLYGRYIAVISAFLVTINALLISFSTSLMTESTYTLFFTLALLLGLLALVHNKTYQFFFAGLGFGACYLIKPEAIGYAILMTALSFGVPFLTGRVDLRRLLLCVAIFLASFGALAGPYIAYVHRETGRWTVSEKLSTNLYYSESNWRRLTPDGQATRADLYFSGLRLERGANNEPQTIPRERAGWFQNLLSKAKAVPATMLESLKGLSAEYQLIPIVVSPIILVLASVGLFRGSWSRARAGREAYLIIFLSATLVGYSLTFQQGRYLVPLVPIFICWGAKGLVEIENWLVASLAQLNVKGSRLVYKQNLVRSAIILLLFVVMLPSLMAITTQEKTEPKAVALWIREHSGKSPLIMANGPWAAFWAGGQHLYLPDEEYAKVLDYARRKKVDYLVFEERHVGKTPQLRFLLDETIEHPGLKLVHQYEEPRSPRVLVFQLVNSTQ
jgi:4-amino-4-deoxy-L-arabinose transferase-like glycosyltransferase